MSRQALLASLEAVADEGAAYFDGGRYLDFSCKSGDGRALEVGDGDGDVVQFDLSRAELLALHSALTKTLLADAE